MALNGSIHGSGQRVILLSALVITTALTAIVTAPVKFLTGMNYLSAQINFVYGSGGTNGKFWIQTTYDGAATWTDIICFAVTTANKRVTSSVCAYIAPAAQAAVATDGTLADDTIIQGTIGSYIRLKYTTTGTYGGSTTATINAVAKG